MKLKPEPINGDITPSKYFVSDQKFLIFGSAALSLVLVWPQTLEIATLSVLIGTPLFWSLFGMTWVHHLIAGQLKLIRFLIVVSIFLTYAYVLQKLITFLSKLI